MRLRRPILALMSTLLWAATLAVHAQSVTVTPLPVGILDEETEYQGVFLLRIDGSIREDLAERLASVLNDRDEFIASLTSPGGDFDEALKVAALFSEHGVGTYVPPGAVCESACAVIFMAGNYGEYEGPGGSQRFLPLSARLGFHAPYAQRFSSAVLNTPYVGTKGDVYADGREKYATAVKQIAQLLSGSQVMGTRWPTSLVAEMLSVPEEGRMRYVETIDDAMRWRIDLLDLLDPDPDLSSDAIAYTACYNWLRWSGDDYWYYYRGDPDHPEPRVDRSEATEDEPAQMWITIDEMVTGDCVFTRDDDGTWHLPDESVLTAGYKYPPSTRLSTLAK